MAQAGVRPVTIPYRTNRAVIFDCDLFHATDWIAFPQSQGNRRISATLLYVRHI